MYSVPARLSREIVAPGPGSPAGAARLPSGRRSEPHELGQVVAHGLGGAAADAQEALVAPHPGDGEVLDVAPAAVELEALVGDLAHQVADEDLGHGDELDGLHGEGLLLHVA